MNRDYLFTSESVSEGHPDKVCDQISDSLVDAYLALESQSRLAIETFATSNNVIIGGEIRAPEISKNDFESIIRNTIKDIGYEQDGFNWKNVKITNLLHEQSPDIAIGVDSRPNKDEGAGDQGIMFGYACDETPVMMPATIYYAHRILQNILNSVKQNKIPPLGPDAKSQITLKYIDGKPVCADNILVSIQHPKGYTPQKIYEIIYPIVKNTLPDGWMCPDNKFLVNPTGNFVIGGPDGDAGLTGRKIIVDTYGGASPHGGGAFSGKDPTKVDRSAAYMARYLAKNIVASGLASRCTLQISYAIGISKPLSLYVNTHNTSKSKINEKDLIKIINDLVDLSPRGIRSYLQLNKPIYRVTSSYGHFGRNPGDDGSFSWERTDLINKLKKFL